MRAMTVHPTAIVSPQARIHPSATIGPFAVIEPGVTIGEGCQILARVSVKTGCSLGGGNRVHEGAVLGGPPQDLSFSGQQTQVSIGDRNVFREGVTIHGSTRPDHPTVVGSDCFLMAYAHVAHDCRLGNGVIMANNSALGGHVEVADRAFVSGGVMVHQFSRIGRLAMVGGQSKVVQDCLPFVTSAGNPARARGLNVVGLRRAGFTVEQRMRLKRAFRLLLRSGLHRAEALESLEGLRDPLVDELVAFVRSSKRGIARLHRGTEDD